MNEYTPTTEEVREAISEWAWARRMFRPELGQSDGLEADRWLAAHDAEVRAEAESDPAKDERLVRYIAMATPLGYQSALTVVQQMTLMIQAETEARRAGVVAEEPEGRRWFSAAYRAQNGNIIPIGDETVLAEYAQKTVDEFSREDDEGPNYFLASRILSPWVPVKQEGAETDA